MKWTVTSLYNTGATSVTQTYVMDVSARLCRVEAGHLNFYDDPHTVKYAFAPGHWSSVKPKANASA